MQRAEETSWIEQTGTRIIEFVKSIYNAYVEIYTSKDSYSGYQEKPEDINYLAALIATICAGIVFFASLIFGWSIGGVGGVLLAIVVGAIVAGISGAIAGWIFLLLCGVAFVGVWIAMIALAFTILSHIWGFLWGLGLPS